MVQTAIFPEPPRSESSRSNDRSALRNKPTPSPLQVSHISSPITDRFVQRSPKDVGSPVSSRGGSGNSYSPRSPAYSPAFHQASSVSPQERGTNQMPLQTRPGSSGSASAEASRNSPATTPKADPYRQMRNVSSPTPVTDARRDSPPHLPSDMAAVRAKSSLSRKEGSLIARTSSIDSTLSSVSSSASVSQSATSGPQSPNQAEIAHMISSAGSPETVIAHLLRERKQATSQNAQLFRLVQKQRSMMVGMKADLDLALKEKELNRKRLKERSATLSPSLETRSKVETLRRTSPAESASSGPSEDELPIQRHSLAEVPVDRPAVQTSARDRQLLGQKPDSSTQRSTDAPGSNHSEIGRIPPGPNPPASAGTVQENSVPDDSRRNTAIQTPMTPIPPLEIHKRAHPVDASNPAKANDIESALSPSSFAARRSYTGARKEPAANSVIAPGSPTEEATNLSPVSRKGPPAPLNLQTLPKASLPKSAEQYRSEDHSDSEYGEVDEVDEILSFDRGRKKTREEDDRERELLLLQEQESRSRSKKNKGSKSVSKSGSKTDLVPTLLKREPPSDPPTQPLPKSPAIRAFAPPNAPPSPTSSLQGHLSPHASLAGVLSGPSSSNGSLVERSIMVSHPPLSPGLPVSPRPIHRQMNNPIPRPARDGFLNSPPLSPPSQSLSPRPPRHPIPMPPHTPTSLGSPLLAPPSALSAAAVEEQQPMAPPKPPALQPANTALQPISPINEQKAVPTVAQMSPVLRPAQSPTYPQTQATDMKVNASSSSHRSVPSDLVVSGIYRGLVSESFPDLLLPPNALPSIIIKVTSSRLKPSRHSVINIKGSEEEPVFTLGVTARSDMKQLWRVEKAVMSLPALEQQLKHTCPFDVKLPDKALFTGQAPVKIDARREALEKYFETMMDTPMIEKAAVIICKYLSTNAIGAEDQEGMKTAGVVEDRSPVTLGPDGTIVKEGYLTKRGKQFGGWKTRFFVLDEPILRYYDTPGGSLQGTIKLSNAQIGRQSAHTVHHSPTRGEDDQFRHAFLIMEPKKKDSNSHIKHVLCAESDAERDEWVVALLQYVGLPAPERTKRLAAPRSTSSTNGSTGHTLKKTQKDDSVSLAESPKNEPFDSLQGTSYEATTQAMPPTRVDAISPVRNTFQPSQAQMAANAQAQAQAQAQVQAQAQAQASAAMISGPRNGAVIQDVGAWGNKIPDSPRSKEKEQKKRSMWGFRDKISDIGASHTNGSNGSVTSHASQQPGVRPVFGIPLNEAVEFCMAPGSNVCLPSVVFRCIEYLEAKDAASEEGIFRLSGSNLVIKHLKEKFNLEGDFNFLADDTYYDVHAVASLLKLYLRELPSMVLTRDLHVDFLRAMELEDKAKKIAAYNVLVHKLPLPNWTLVRALSAFLITIINNSSVNKMSVRNVGIVFAPTLNIPAPVFATFLTDFEPIFVADPADESAIEPAQTSPLTPDDIRSPRKQIFSDLPTPSHPHDMFQMPGRNGSYDELPTSGRRGVQSSHNNPNDLNREAPTGFIPVQPSYETSNSLQPSRANQGNRASVLMPGPDHANFQRNPHPAALGATGIMRDTKARRRESSMMFMQGAGGNGGVGSPRNHPMPSMIGNLAEES